MRVNGQTNWSFPLLSRIFKFRTKKKNRRFCCSFGIIFHRRVPSVFSPVSDSRQISSSLYRQIGLTSVCRTWSVIESPDRSTGTPITITLFSILLPKDVTNYGTKTIGPNQFGFWGESSSRFRYFDLHCHLQFYVFQRESWTFNAVGDSWFSNKNSKGKQTKMIQQCDGLWNDFFVSLAVVSFCGSCVENKWTHGHERKESLISALGNGGLWEDFLTFWVKELRSQHRKRRTTNNKQLSHICRLE